MGTYEKCLSEVLLMSYHNIFSGRNKKNINMLKKALNWMPRLTSLGYTCSLDRACTY